MKTHTIIILEDGESWSRISGCSIVVINDEQFKDLCLDSRRTCELEPLVEIALTEMSIGS